MLFKDRHEAGKQLARKLSAYNNATDTIVIALPRGGVVTGFEIARALHLPLDIVLSKKIGSPTNLEFAIGAVSEDGAFFLNTDTHEDPKYIEQQKKILVKKMSDKKAFLREGLTDNISLKGKTVLLVDDGIATGQTMYAAIAFLKKQKTAKIIVAVPVAPLDTAHKMKDYVDEFICLYTPSEFGAIGNFYENFVQISDEQAHEYLIAAQTKKL